jgi:hypothetical protein
LTRAAEEDGKEEEKSERKLAGHLRPLLLQMVVKLYHKKALEGSKFNDSLLLHHPPLYLVKNA